MPFICATYSTYELTSTLSFTLGMVPWKKWDISGATAGEEKDGVPTW